MIDDHTIYQNRTPELLKTFCCCSPVNKPSQQAQLTGPAARQFSEHSLNSLVAGRPSKQLSNKTAQQILGKQAQETAQQCAQ